MSEIAKLTRRSTLERMRSESTVGVIVESKTRVVNNKSKSKRNPMTNLSFRSVRRYSAGNYLNMDIDPPLLERLILSDSVMQSAWSPTSLSGRSSQ